MQFTNIVFFVVLRVVPDNGLVRGCAVSLLGWTKDKVLGLRFERSIPLVYDFDLFRFEIERECLFGLGKEYGVDLLIGVGSDGLEVELVADLVEQVSVVLELYHVLQLPLEFGFLFAREQSRGIIVRSSLPKYKQLV